MQHVHVCLVSEQPNPNLTPLIDKSMEVSYVILCHTEKTRLQASWLQSTLRDFQISSELVLLDSVNDIDKLREQFLALFELNLRQEGRILYSNVTGGTKPMSLALFETAYLTESDGSKAYYIDLNNHLSWLIPSGQDSQILQNRIKLKHFLKVRGFELEESDNCVIDSRKTKKLTDFIVQNSNKFRKALAQLNYFAMTAKDDKRLCSKEYQGNEVFEELIDELVHSKLVARTEDGKLIFTSEVARFYCNGGWLEEYLYYCVRDIATKKAIREIQLGVKVVREGVRNEIDLMVLLNNRVVMIECKTYKADNIDEVNSSLYKLDDLTQKIGGATALGVFVSLNKIEKANIKRARQYGIDIISGEQLVNMKQKLEMLLSNS